MARLRVFDAEMLDSSGLTVAETVQQVLANTAAARVAGGNDC